jgi:hypothetical protein
VQGSEVSSRASFGVTALIPKREDFWTTEEDDTDSPTVQTSNQFHELAGSKTLWIVTAEASQRSSIKPSLPEMPTLASPRSSKGTFYEQQQRHVQMMALKQPLGRDGKPLPVLKMTNSHSAAGIGGKKTRVFASVGESIASSRYKGK